MRIIYDNSVFPILIFQIFSFNAAAKSLEAQHSVCVKSIGFHLVRKID